MVYIFISNYLIDNYLDNFCGRGTNVITAAHMGRRVVGYDLSKASLDLIESVCTEHIQMNQGDLMLYHSDGVGIVEYEAELTTLIRRYLIPPYIF